MYSKNKILKCLEKDKIRNINIINFINEYPISSIDVISHSMLVRGTSDKNWVYISSSSSKEFKTLINKLDNNDKFFAVIEDWMIPLITDGRKLSWQLSCIKLYYPDYIVLPQNKYNIEHLNIEDAKYIYNNYEYKKYTSIDYLTERIRKGIGLGIYENDKLVGWIITHDDGAIGFLNVLPDYRRKGYAYELTIAMIKELRESHEIPFVHIEEDNIKSMNLALKLGFINDRKVSWIKLIK